MIELNWIELSYQSTKTATSINSTHSSCNDPAGDDPVVVSRLWVGLTSILITPSPIFNEVFLLLYLVWQQDPRLFISDGRARRRGRCNLCVYYYSVKSSKQNKPIRTKLKWPFGSLLTHWVYSLFTVNATKKYILKGVNILHKGVACCTQENVSSQNWNFWERSEYLAIRRPPMLVHFPTHDHRRNSLCKLGHEGIVTLRSYRKFEFRISSIGSQLAQIFQNCH